MSSFVQGPDVSQGSAGHAVQGALRVKQRVVELVIVPESEAGGFSAHVPSLPGVHSEGDDPIEAFSNIQEALTATIQSYRERGEDVPWLDEWPAELDPNHKSKWIQVDDA